jgi:hypothetical protein
LGAVWGEEMALHMLSETGFTDIKIVDFGDPFNTIYVCRK